MSGTDLNKTKTEAQTGLNTNEKKLTDEEHETA